MTRGGGGVSQKVILHDEGGRGGPDPPKKDDVIYEQPLTQKTEKPAGHHFNLPGHSLANIKTTEIKTVKSTDIQYKKEQ